MIIARKRWQCSAKTERERKWQKGSKKKKGGGGRGRLLAFQQDEKRFLAAKHRLRVRLLHPLSWNAPKIESGRHFAAIRVCRRFCPPSPPLLLFYTRAMRILSHTSLSTCETALARATRILNTATCTVISRVTCRDCTGLFRVHKGYSTIRRRCRCTKRVESPKPAHLRDLRITSAITMRSPRTISCSAGATRCIQIVAQWLTIQRGSVNLLRNGLRRPRMCWDYYPSLFSDRVAAAYEARRRD